MNDLVPAMPAPPNPLGTGTRLPPPPPPLSSRLTWIFAVLTVVALLVVASSFGLVHSPDNRSVQRPNQHELSLSFSPGQDIHYHLMTRMRLSVRRFHRNIPIRGRASSFLTWHVVSVDPTGIATVLVSRYNATVRMYGQQRTLPPQQLTFHVTADGQVIAPIGSTQFSGGAILGQIGGLDQLSAFLPSSDAEPGDTWTKNDSMNLFGDDVAFAAHCAYRRNVRVGSTSAAVISSQAVILMDFVSSPSHGGRSMRFTGEMRTRAATWIDLGAKDILRTRGRARLTFGVLVTGDASGAPGTAFNMTGKVWTTLTRR